VEGELGAAGVDEGCAVLGSIRHCLRLGKGGRGREGKETYTRADAAIAFLDSLVAFTKWSLGFQSRCHVAAVAGAGVEFWVLDFCAWRGAAEGVGGVGWSEDCAVVGGGFEGPEVDVAEASSLYIF